jgi:Tfp pilus assembly protein PilN
MQHINFLESKRFRLTEFKKFEVNYFWMMVMVAVLVLLCIGYGLMQRYRVGSLQGQLDAVVEEIKKSSGVSVKKAGTAERPGFLDPLRSRVLWAPVLSETADHTPEAIWLKSIQGSLPGGRQVKIVGWSLDVISVAHFEKELEGVPIYSKVQLQHSTEKESEAGRHDLEFEINAVLK